MSNSTTANREVELMCRLEDLGELTDQEHRCIAVALEVVGDIRKRRAEEVDA
jgi:hypothetical protein